MKYLHLRIVENKQIYASFAKNYLDITDFRTRIEQGILIENKQLEIKYFLRQIGMNFKLLENLEKIALNLTEGNSNMDKLEKVKFLIKDIKEKNDYLKYRYRLLSYEFNQLDNLKIGKDNIEIEEKEMRKIL